MSISSTRFSDPSSSYNNIPTDQTDETNKTSDVNEPQDATPPALPATESTDEAIKNLPSNQATTEVVKFSGDFQAYRLQKALSEQSQQRKPVQPPASQKVSTTAQGRQSAPAPGQAASPTKPASVPTRQSVSPSKQPSIPSAQSSTQSAATKPSQGTPSAAPTVSPAEAKIFVQNKFNDGPQAFGKELALRLASPNKADKDLVRASLIELNKNYGPAISSTVAKNLVDHLSDGHLKSAAQTPEGAKSLNLTRAFLNQTSGNEPELARVGKALTSTVPSIQSANATQRSNGTYSEANAILFQHQTKGVSKEHAASDKIPYGGVEASNKMAETDRKRVLTYRQQFIDVGKKYHLPPAILAGIASRESRGGAALGPDGFSSNGKWFGLLQVNKENHEIKGKYNSVEHIDQAAGILSNYREIIKKKIPDLSEAEVLRGAVAAYNRGENKIQSKEAIFENEYSSDIWARSQYYARNFDGGNQQLVNTPINKGAASPAT